MAHHLLETDAGFLKDYRNVLLIRDPRQLIASFSKVISHPTMRDIGIERQYELYQMLSPHCPVIDSNVLLRNPEKILTALCKQLGIAFEKEMLAWQPHRLSEDGVWAKYWYGNVHASSGFSKPSDSAPHLPVHCQVLYEECIAYYDTLSKVAIR